MENLRLLLEFIGKIDLRTDYICLYAGIIKLDSQVKRYIMLFIITLRISALCALCNVLLFYHFDMHFFNNNTISGFVKKAKIFIATKTLESDKKLSVHKAVQIYDVPETTLRNRIGDTNSIAERRLK